MSSNTSASKVFLHVSSPRLPGKDPVKDRAAVGMATVAEVTRLTQRYENREKENQRHGH